MAAAPAVAEVFAEWSAGLEPQAIPQAARAVADNALLDVAGLCIAARATDYVRAALAAWDRRRRVHRPRPCPRPGCRRRRADQRHRGAWRGFRRQLRGHAGARQRRGPAGGARGGRALWALRRRCAARLRGRHRVDVPPRAGRPDRDPPRRLPSDRGDRRARGGRGRRRDAPPVAAAADQRARHRRQHGLGHPRVPRRGRLDQAAARRLGGAGGPARGSARARGLSRPAHGPRRRARLLPRLRHRGHRARLPLRDRGPRRRPGRWPRSRSSPTPAAPCCIPSSTARSGSRAKGVDATEVREVVCRVGEGTVHRLWEPLAEKRTPTTAYSAKFSGPFAVALGLVEQAAGLEQFTEAKVRDPDLLALAAKVALRDRPRERVPAQLHRRRPPGAPGRQCPRGASALSARRRARAAGTCRDRGQVPRQCRPWRLAGRRDPGVWKRGAAGCSSSSTFARSRPFAAETRCARASRLRESSRSCSP